MIEIGGQQYDIVLGNGRGKDHIARWSSLLLSYVYACGRVHSGTVMAQSLGEKPITCERCRNALRPVLGFTRADNARRGELINKEFAGFTDEEGGRRLDLDPAWNAEYERRVAANLTDEERAELSNLQARADRFASLVSPLPTRYLDDLERQIAQIKDRREG